ncbi:MAG: heavy-metal-associated domain-containing protein [bacterium]|nr:heavy-metal-associated domain-containing protein [bacterium]
MKKKFKITGMHCSSCAITIDMDLEDLPGIKKAQTSYAKGETEVEFDPDKVNVGNIVAAIEKSGYKVIEKFYERARKKTSF